MLVFTMLSLSESAVLQMSSTKWACIFKMAVNWSTAVEMIEAHQLTPNLTYCVEPILAAGVI